MAKQKGTKPPKDLAQIGEGYGCSCGYTTTDKADLGRHFFVEGRKDGPGTHKSIGRVNLETGAVVMKPWNERSDEEKELSTVKRSTSDTGASTIPEETKPDGNGTKPAAPPSPQKPSMIRTLAETSQIRLIPRSLTINLTPIMQMAYHAACNEWGWPEYSLEDFFDTCLVMMFRERGIILSGYIVRDDDENQESNKSNGQGG